MLITGHGGMFPYLLGGGGWEAYIHTHVASIGEIKDNFIKYNNIHTDTL